MFKINKISVGCLLSLVLVSSCGNNKSDPSPSPVASTTTSQVSITINPTSVKQQMIGFGGALTWYSNWVTANNKVNDIADLMFSDLGIDIIRFKNWYYPDNYPADKTTNTMTVDGSMIAWEATNALYDLAKNRNPDIKILLSSWGPPAVLKSNNQLAEGTLKKDNSGAFMYDAFAQYWRDVLDNTPFNPDYISIQNEPTFVNAGWTTCQWSNTETSTLPDYNIAFNKVYSQISTRAHVPVMVGPESANMPAFVSFANILKNNPNCGAYAFHPYDISSGTSVAGITRALQSVGAFNTKPILMTEFSDNLDWLSTASFINNALIYGNISGYIYWKLTWNTPTSGEDAAMISMASPGATSNFTVTPYFYLIKHFSKNIDAGYFRVDASSSSTSLSTTAFINPANDKLTVIIVNSGTQANVGINATGKTITGIEAVQSSVAGGYYKQLTIASPAQSISLPAKSITTLVLDI